MGIYHDITEKKNMEMQEKKILAELVVGEKAQLAAEEALRRAVTVLAGSIAHDLRTPLAAALLHIDFIAQSQAESALTGDNKMTHGIVNDKNVTTCRKTIDSSIKIIKKIIYDMNDIIDVTLKSMQRLVSGTLSSKDFTVCSVAECVHQVIVRYPFKKNEKELLHAENIDDFTFLGIPVLFYRILFNLIGNAFYQIEKNKQGQIFIQTETTPKWNILCIRDTAGGVSPDALAHLFDGFKTSRKNGTGVGLAFCKLTMESFGGHISAHSVEGDYIEFVLSFPIHKEST
ncbi:MAG: HAMP domain-containing histidine kinase [Gammaproteobacteria bacterium]|nr:HAMP domain-containing histidine kinase [Gammaproteobacteria bacterium]